MTQYQAILDHLRKHKVATVRDLLRYTNYPSARIFEMRNRLADVGPDGKLIQERITRTWIERGGKKVRLYCLTKA